MRHNGRLKSTHFQNTQKQHQQKRLQTPSRRLLCSMQMRAARMRQDEQDGQDER